MRVEPWELRGQAEFWKPPEEEVAGAGVLLLMGDIPPHLPRPARL